MIKSKSKIDLGLLVIVLGLLFFGLVALYSASTVESYQRAGNTTYYIYHQILYGAVVGLVALFICSKIDYHIWQKYLPAILIGALVLLAAVKVSGFSYSAGGATRWLKIGFISFQPSELAKLAIIFYLAAWIEKKHHKFDDFYFGILPSLVLTALFAALILWQPDLGTMLVLVLVAAAMLFTAGINWKYFFWSAAAGMLLLFALIKTEPYRLKRITTFLDPAHDPQGIGYHINQALLAIGAGGLWGYGYGLSRQKYNYLPEVMGDSIFAVLAEELGFLRIIIVIALFLLFALKGIKIAKAAPDLFGKMTAFGITFWLTIQALINIAAMVSLVPLTGIPLPFFSYGSTALILNLAAVGILFNISRSAHLKKV